MPLTLTGSELDGLQKLMELLQSPLSHADPDDWRRAVARDARDLLRAQSAVLICPIPGRPLALATGVDPTLSRAYDEHFHAQDRGRELAKRRGLDVATYDTLFGPDLYHSEFFNEFLRPAGTCRVLGISMDIDDSPPFAVLAAHRDSLSRPDFGERELELGRLLLPAMRAGVSAARLLAHRRSVIESLVDTLDQRIALVEADGALHLNRPLLELLEGDPERSRVESIIQQTGRTARRPAGKTGGGPPPGELHVTTGRGAYRLRFLLLGGAPFQAYLLVMVDPLFPVLPALEEAAHRFGLTRQQSRVAALLAAGHDNHAIADALVISPHTARRHTEAVLRKLDVRSRHQVADRLRPVRR